MKKIILIGATGGLGKEIVKYNDGRFEFYCPTREELNIANKNAIVDYFYNFIFENVNIHSVFLCAALSSPMKQHEMLPEWSIETNVIGTANVAEYCAIMNKKMIYVSTDFVYSGTEGNYSEGAPVKPVNNYAWSKLGGECAVQMLPEHLIFRCGFTDRPFNHLYALADSYKSLMYVDEAAKNMLKLIDSDCSGTYNIGGPRTSNYDFAKKENPNVQKIYRAQLKEKMPYDTSMNVDKMMKEMKKRD